jgi:hypothetical protein
VSKLEQKEIRLEIGMPSDGFPKCMYFNRFRIEREEGFCPVQFGLVSGSALLDSYSCVLPPEMLSQNQKSLLDYLNQIGRPAERSPAPWKGAPVEKQVDVADIVGMSFRATMAETCFYFYSFCGASRIGKSGAPAGSFPSQPLALLRSATELQKQLITGLYEE